LSRLSYNLTSAPCVRHAAIDAASPPPAAPRPAAWPSAEGAAAFLRGADRPATPTHPPAWRLWRVTGGGVWGGRAWRQEVQQESWRRHRPARARGVVERGGHNQTISMACVLLAESTADAAPGTPQHRSCWRRCPARARHGNTSAGHFVAATCQHTHHIAEPRNGPTCRCRQHQR